MALIFNHFTEKRQSFTEKQVGGADTAVTLHPDRNPPGNRTKLTDLTVLVKGLVKNFAESTLNGTQQRHE